MGAQAAERPQLTAKLSSPGEGPRRSQLPQEKRLRCCLRSLILKCKLNGRLSSSSLFFSCSPVFLSSFNGNLGEHPVHLFRKVQAELRYSHLFKSITFVTLNVGHYSKGEETDHATQRPDPRCAVDAAAEEESHPARTPRSSTDGKQVVFFFLRANSGKI